MWWDIRVLCFGYDLPTCFQDLQDVTRTGRDSDIQKVINEYQSIRYFPIPELTSIQSQKWFADRLLSNEWFFFIFYEGRVKFTRMFTTKWLWQNWNFINWTAGRTDKFFGWGKGKNWKFATTNFTENKKISNWKF